MKNAKEKELYYDHFINSLDFTNTGIYPPFKKPVGIKQIKKLLFGVRCRGETKGKMNN